MVLWSRLLNRRGGLSFTSELRMYFAVRIIQNWWINVRKTRAKRINNNNIENVIR